MPYESLAPCSGGVKLIQAIAALKGSRLVNNGEKIVNSTTVQLEPLPIQLYPVR
jgi:hypothetical protein